MDTRQLRYFQAIYEHGSLTAAAEHARVAVSALSHHLANLEAELTTSLFVREPRGMQPTAAGERLYGHAKSILKAMSAAERDIREAAGEISGEVSVGMAYSAVKAIGVDLIRSVLTDYPKLRLSLTESLSGTALMHLLATDIDLALVYNPPIDTRLKRMPVLEERMICIGRRELIGATDKPIQFSELLELPIIMLRQGASARAVIDDMKLLRKLEARAKLQMNSVHAITGSVVAGLGCVVGTTLFLREPLESGLLHSRPIVKPQLSRTLYTCQMADRPTTFALQAVQDVILKLIRSAIHNGRWEAKILDRNKASIS
jgi:LysR family nitrogen assimilation transcriptional regulator